MMSEIVKYKRYLDLQLPAGQSAFLWGPRKTGKSTYLKSHFPDSVRYDLLETDLYLRLTKQPHLLREEILALPENERRLPIIIDEVQKIPELLDEVHWLIENAGISFILCGSSARKLKRGAANLLGGRAWRFTFYPLVYPEIPGFELLRALNSGLIPSHYLQEDARRSLRAYWQDYLTEEIQAEGLVRNLGAFTRFLDALAFSHGELINFSSIARESSIDSKTVKEYYQIMIDTLAGYFIYPYKKQRKRDIIMSMPKFYLFDVGAANSLLKRRISELKGHDAGKAFEHFILMELMAYKGLNELDFDITFWRTKSGLEVDFILGDAEVAIEVKIGDKIDKSDLKGLIAFTEEYQPKHSIVVSTVPKARKIALEEANGAAITVLPWQDFLEQLRKKKLAG